MREPVYSENYKGLKINIFQDEDARSPDEDGDEELFLVGYHRDFTVDRGSSKDGRHTPGISQSLAQDIARGGKYEDGSVNEEAREYCRKYHVFGLEAYIHSGVALALSREGNFPDRCWDVSQLGLVFVSKKAWKTRPAARKAALGLIEEWNNALSGNVYGYVVEGAPGVNSCWGFYGDYEKGALPEARSMAEYAYKEIIRAKTARVKALIKNKVPLVYREA